MIDTIYIESGTYYAGLDELRVKTVDGTNVALNKTVTASTSHSVWKSIYLTDGALTTSGNVHGWAGTSQFADGVVNGAEYAIIDLGAVVDITRIEVVSLGSLGGGTVPTGIGALKNYRLQSSTNGTDYSTVTTFTGGVNIGNRQDIFTYTTKNNPQNSAGGV